MLRFDPGAGVVSNAGVDNKILSFQTAEIGVISPGASVFAQDGVSGNTLGLYTNYLSSGQDRLQSTSNSIIIAPQEVISMIYKGTGAARFYPMTQPANPQAGDVYYDSGTNKLRCYNGTIWNDLF